MSKPEVRKNPRGSKSNPWPRKESVDSERQLVIRILILPHHTATFRKLWKDMEKLGITSDFGPTLHEAIYSELQNLQLRWEDAISDAESEAARREEEAQ